MTSTALCHALNYLKNEAIDAHLSGDGMRAIHLCTVALEEICKVKRLGTCDVMLNECRWAFFLGLYWFIDDWFLYKLRDALQAVTVDDDSTNDVILITYLMTTLQIPVNFESTDKLELFSNEWFQKRSTFIEDVAALSLAIEISWYDNPFGDIWTRLLSTWSARAADGSALKNDLTRMHERLLVQSRLYAGEAMQESTSVSPGFKAQQELLIKAWQLYYDAEFAALHKLLSDLPATVSVESPLYPAFFRILHISRVPRESKESQFLALSRLSFMESRQPAQFPSHIRDERFNSNYAAMARAGFPDGVANQRFTCFRMALLNQLHSLRMWDIGGWLHGERQRAQIAMELGARGDSQFAKSGVVSTVISLADFEPHKHPHLARCVQLLDSLTDTERASLVQLLIKMPRAAWGSAQHLIETLSDAIPNDLLMNVARWSVQLDSDKYHARWRHTYLDWWGDHVLNLLDNPSELIELLKPALLAKVNDSRTWDKLHDTLISSIVKGEDNTAKLLFEALVRCECNEDHWNRYRFSILYNIAQLRPQFADRCRDWMRSYAQQHNLEFESFQLRRMGIPDDQPVDDAAFRQWLINELTQYCTERMMERGHEYTLGALPYHSMVRYLTWPVAEPELVNALIAVVDSSHIPYVNKGEPLACLAVFASNSPREQGILIANNAMRWLDETIRGQGWENPGPLSTGQFLGMGQDAIFDGFLFLLDQVAKSYSEICGEALAKWILVHAVRIPVVWSGHVIRVVLHLSVALGESNESLATALVGIAEAVAQKSFATEPVKTIGGFRSVVFGERRDESVSRWLDSMPGRLCLRMWEERAIEASRLADPNARRAIALLLRDWNESGLLNSEKLGQTIEKLRVDSRLRVRAASGPR